MTPQNAATHPTIHPDGLPGDWRTWGTKFSARARPVCLSRPGIKLTVLRGEQNGTLFKIYTSKQPLSMSRMHDNDGPGSPDNNSAKEKVLDTRDPSLSEESGKGQPMLAKDGVTKIEALCKSSPRRQLTCRPGPQQRLPPLSALGRHLSRRLRLFVSPTYLWTDLMSRLQSTTTGVYLQFATSTFGRHSMLGTIGIINKIIAAVIKPVIARTADFTSRPTVLTAGLFFFTVGYIVVAAAQNVQDLAGGEVLYTIGSNTLGFIRGLLVADLTSLQNRGLVSGIMFLPFVPNGFISGYIAEGIGGLRGEGWRWGVRSFTCSEQAGRTVELTICSTACFASSSPSVSLRPLPSYTGVNGAPKSSVP